MSRLKDKVWQAAVFVSLALILINMSEANARGGGGHGVGGFSRIYSTSAAPRPSARTHTTGYRGGHGHGGGRGGYGNYGNYYGDSQNYYQQPGPVNGQVFSGSAHITPSEYGRYVQSYQWPSHQP